MPDESGSADMTTLILLTASAVWNLICVIWLSSREGRLQRQLDEVRERVIAVETIIATADEEMF